MVFPRDHEQQDQVKDQIELSVKYNPDVAKKISVDMKFFDQ